jgi:hypothetical protein
MFNKVNSKIISLMLSALFLAASSQAHAQVSGENILFAGSGSGKDADSKAYSIGYLRVSNSTDRVWGVDVGGEGYMEDSTWGNYKSSKQATSFNVLFGKNLHTGEGYRIDGTLIAGVREKSSSCSKSYLGYQCYADTAPDTKYSLNYGALLAVSYKSLTLGVRATGESKQVLLGIRF